MHKKILKAFVYSGCCIALISSSFAVKAADKTSGQLVPLQKSSPYKRQKDGVCGGLILGVGAIASNQKFSFEDPPGGNDSLLGDLFNADLGKGNVTGLVGLWGGFEKYLCHFSGSLEWMPSSLKQTLEVAGYSDHSIKQKLGNFAIRLTAGRRIPLDPRFLVFGGIGAVTRSYTYTPRYIGVEEIALPSHKKRVWGVSPHVGLSYNFGSAAVGMRYAPEFFKAQKFQNSGSLSIKDPDTGNATDVPYDYKAKFRPRNHVVMLTVQVGKLGGR